MPLPLPHKNEKQDEFISRCMANPTMNEEYPDQKQRAAVCYSQWRGEKKMQPRLLGGKADGMAPTDFDQDQLRIGTLHELEHTNNPAQAQKIAMDHLAENPDYYRKLEKAGLAIKFRSYQVIYRDIPVKVEVTHDVDRHKKYVIAYDSRTNARTWGNNEEEAIAKHRRVIDLIVFKSLSRKASIKSKLTRIILQEIVKMARRLVAAEDDDCECGQSLR